MSNTLKYNQSEIRFGNLADTGFNEVLNSEKFTGAKKVIIIDETVSDLWLEFLLTSFDALHEAEIIQLPPGEENKTLEICAQVWGALSEYEISRNDLIINIGGGVITDMGGFIAATFKRGLRFINVPTTLLSQVDASVGGKTGIDFGPFKNQVGVFADPEYVFIDSNFLTTLDPVELLSGYAEMLKHGLIANSEYWTKLKSIDPIPSPEKLLDVIQFSVNIKKDIVEQDHKELGLRKHLNFGHTIGHAIEGFLLSNGTPIPHGNGVAWGMVAEAFLAKSDGMISEDDFSEIDTFIRKMYPPLDVSITEIEKILELLKNDKKNRQNQINFTLINGIGSAVYDQTVSRENIISAIEFVLAD